MGHVKLILKSDQERALVALVRQALIALRHQIPDMEGVSSEHSTKYDSKSNGGTETGAHTLRGHLRTMKLCLESRMGHAIPNHHPIMI